MENRIINSLTILMCSLHLCLSAQVVQENKTSTKREHLSEPSSTQSIFLNSNPAFGENSNWQLKKFDSLDAGGAQISQPGMQGKGWSKAIVPGTVLTSLVENQVYPDPYFGDVNRRTRKIIPDMADAGREFYHYWYRTDFKVPENFTGKRIWLKLNGINYKSEIWLNGKKLGSMAGMFNSKSFDITDLVNREGTNGLAVNVLPVDFSGQSGLKGKVRSGAKGENQNGGDGMIGKNTTMLMSVGWDFTFQDGIRDRNTGIWKEVELYTTGDVVLKNPFVQTKLNLPIQPVQNKRFR